MISGFIKLVLVFLIGFILEKYVYVRYVVFVGLGFDCLDIFYM